MRAVVFTEFGGTPELRDVPDPVPSADGVVIRVETTGVCRSDAHGWLGHDDGIALPHVPGHELVGRIAAVGPEVTRFRIGERVTVPFVSACGRCPECAGGNGQVCRNQTQPGFTHWGSFAELVALHNADVNLIPVPDGLDSGAAALLGCRFATAYRGLVHRARLQRGERLLVVGCGGVGLSAAMIGVALGAEVIAVDIDPVALERASSLGAAHTIDSSGLSESQVLEAIASVAPTGIQVSVEALGRQATMRLSVLALAPLGRQVQIGLFSEEPAVPLPTIIAKELSLHGSHGMPASDYPALLDLVLSGALDPARLIEHRIGLAEAPAALQAIAAGDRSSGVTVVDIARRLTLGDPRSGSPRIRLVEGEILFELRCRFGRAAARVGASVVAHDEVRMRSAVVVQPQVPEHDEPAETDRSGDEPRRGGHTDRPARAEAVRHPSDDGCAEGSSAHEDRHVERHHAATHPGLGGGLHVGVGAGHHGHRREPDHNE